MRFATSITAVAGLVSMASAHVKMTTPVPFAASSLDNAPLLPDGSNFPCKMPDYSAVTRMNDMPLGSTQPMAFLGSAVHGGGSCQVSITYDNPPTKDSVWKVIHSIEGGCPMANIAGNNGDNAAAPVPDQFSFTVPTNLPTGPAVLAWTWFNRIGNREMYMNCAPINLQQPGTAKRTATEAFEEKLSAKIASRQEAFLSSLPDMFTANIGDGCGTTEGSDLRFPNAGQSVELRSSGQLVDPVGNSCQAKGSAPQASAPIAAAPTAVPTVSPGEFVELPGPVDGDRAAENKPVENAPVYDAPVVAEPTPSPEPAAPVEEAPAQNETAPAPEIPTVGGSAIAPGTPCPNDEGMWNCVDSAFFQRCASGQWSIVQAIASGTTCASGISSSIKIVSMPAAKREVRFSNAHVRRHLNARSL